MKKRMLWYVCLGLLCSAVLGFAVQASQRAGREKKVVHRPATVLRAGQLQSESLAVPSAPTAVKRGDAAQQASNFVGNPAKEEAIQDLQRRYLAGETLTPAEKDFLSPYLPEGRNEANPMDAVGGPDGSWYYFWDNQAADTVSDLDWIELCGVADAIDGPIGDDAASSAAIGWNFPFYGNLYNTCWVSTNGLISFGGSNTSYTASDPATTAPTYPYVAPLWTDCNTNCATGGCTPGSPWIRWKNFGSYFVVEWYHLPQYNLCANLFSFQAILYPNGRVKVQYNSDFAMPNPTSDGNSTIGVDAPGATNGVTYGYAAVGGAWTGIAPAASRVIWFYQDLPPVPELSVSMLAPCGAVQVNPAATVSFRVFNGGGAASSPVTAHYVFDGGATIDAPVPAISQNSFFDVFFGPMVNITAGAHTLSGWFTPHDTPSANDSAACTITGQVRPCAVMTPADVNLDPLPNTPWAGSIAGNCGNEGKWVGSFTGVAGTVNHFDLCPDVPGAGTADFDIDIKICDAAGTIFAGQDGSCSALAFRPNDFQWIAPSNGTYYVVLAPYFSYSVHSCTGLITNTFTMEYYAAVCPLPVNDDCQNVTPVALPATFTGTRDCATPDCPSFAQGQGNVWIAFTTTGDCNITLDYCGSPATGNAWLNLALGCPCTSFTAAATFEQTTCAPNITMTWTAIPPGTYYYPVMRYDALGAVGPYTIHVTCTPYVPPTGRCCYGDVYNPTCASPVTQAECTALTGTWAQGLDCTTPCPIPPPPCADGNDNCASVTIVTDCPFSCTGTTVGYVNDYTDWGTGPDRIYQFTTLATSDITVSLCGSAFDTEVSLRTGATCPGTVVAGNDDNGPLCAGAQSSLVALSQPAGTYWVVVDGWGGNSGVYDLSISASPCFDLVCEPAADLTVLRGVGPANDVNLRWYASQTLGTYKVYRTANKNNDGNPDNGADPDFGSAIASVPAPGAPGFLTVSDTPLSPYYNYVVVHDCAPTGRCCYGDPTNPSCQSPVTAEACIGLAGDWTSGLNCTDDPCPIRPPNDDCGNAIPETCPFSLTADNTGATNDGACLLDPTGAEIWYTFTLAEASAVTVTECGLSGNWTQFYWVVTPDCPCTSYILKDTYTYPDPACPNGGIIFSFNNLPAGTYYLPIAMDPTYGSVGEFTLSVTCTPTGPFSCNGTVIPSLPYTVDGNTCGQGDDFDEACEWGTAPGVPDVSYTYTPTVNETVTITTCLGTTDYDTKLFVYENGSVIACVDDWCQAPLYIDGPYNAEIDALPLTAGNSYCIVVDGYYYGIDPNTDCGNYTLSVTSP